MEKTPRRIVFTGGPGFGKSTVLRILAERGFLCVPEAPRELIIEQQALDNGILPQDNFPRFADLVLDRMIRQFRDTAEGLVLYDRGLPDLPAYLSSARIEVPAGYRKALDYYRYDSPVFYFPPWEEIYNIDGIRYETFEQAVRIGELIRNSYSAEGYQVLEVPAGPAEERADFVAKQLEDI